MILIDNTRLLSEPTHCLLVERGHKDFVICRLKQRFNEIICNRCGVDVNLADKLRNAARIHGLTVIVEHGVALRILHRVASKQIVNDNLEHIVDRRILRWFRCRIRIRKTVKHSIKHLGNIKAAEVKEAVNYSKICRSFNNITDYRSVVLEEQKQLLENCGISIRI